MRFIFHLYHELATDWSLFCEKVCVRLFLGFSILPETLSNVGKILFLKQSLTKFSKMSGLSEIVDFIVSVLIGSGPGVLFSDIKCCKAELLKGKM